MTSDDFWGIFDLPTYLNQILYHIHKPIYLNQMQINLPKNLTSYVVTVETVG
jgi:hypothetical protein